MRYCALCGVQKAALQLKRLRGTWLCAPCYHEHVARPRKPKEKGEARAGTPEDGAGARGQGRRKPDPDLVWSLHVVDAGFRFGGLALRIVVYGVLYALAESTGFGPHLMAGFLLADGLTWTVAALFAMRFHRLTVAAETLFFAVLFLLWLQAGWSFPDHPADRAILGLAAFATLTAKTAALTIKLTR